MKPTNPYAMKPELEVIGVLKKSLEMIKKLSYESCRHDDGIIEDNSRYINNLARESYKLLDRRESSLRAGAQEA
jgi:hypothetical protein